GMLDATPGALIAIDSYGQIAGYNTEAQELFAPADASPEGISLPPSLHHAVGRALRDHTANQQGEVAVAGQRIGYTVRLAGDHASEERIAFVSAQRVESSEDFLALAAHELKTPLTAIKGGTQLLARRSSRSESPLSERDLELLHMVTGQVDQLAGMVDNLLEASRLVQDGVEIAPQTHDLTALLAHIVQQFPAPPGATLAAPDAAIHVPCDSQRVTQIMRALLQNAAEAKATEPVGVTLRATGSEARVAVSDTGRGISPEDEPHVFKRFYRGAGAGAHLGLGLYIASELVRLHNGRLWLSTTPGKGTTVSFTLPCS
ncbi:MAG: HAMP domain-containing histidine kinase, partial [Chloroflexota bacterium]|nr:HAMP domain-containing histidine kinase [Chloroflexota bacterium]